MAALSVYLLTLAPGLTFAHHGADGGDLIVAAHTLGVPHPTGYPSYVLLAWLFTHLPVGSLAYRTNLLSALCASGAVALLYATARRLLPQGHPPAVAAAAALTLGFAPLFWSQAVITEVYALLALFAGLFTFSLARWRSTLRPAYLWLAAAVLAVGLGNHLTLALAAPPALLLLWPTRRHWLRLHVLLPAAGLFAAGLSVYVYLPLAAARHPPVAWGDPQTPEGFLWLVTAEPYRHLFFSMAPAEALDRLGSWARLLVDQTGWWGLALALAGAALWWHHDRRAAAFGLSWAALAGLVALFYGVTDSHVYLVAALWVLAICWGFGASLLLSLSGRLRQPWPRLTLLGVLLLPLVTLGLHWRAIDLSRDSSATVALAQTLQVLDPGSLVLVQGDRPTFSLWYGVYAKGQRPDVSVVNVPLLAYPWYREQVRRAHPELVVPESLAAAPDLDDTARTLIIHNLPARPVYAADPGAWGEWFDLVEEPDAPVYRVHLKTRWEHQP